MLFELVFKATYGKGGVLDLEGHDTIGILKNMFPYFSKCGQTLFESTVGNIDWLNKMINDNELIPEARKAFPNWHLLQKANTVTDLIKMTQDYRNLRDASFAMLFAKIDKKNDDVKSLTDLPYKIKVLVLEHIVDPRLFSQRLTHRIIDQTVNKVTQIKNKRQKN